ncbi:MAG: TetR/AcrR family transcriptional regulator [Actinobacteria bacterium]|nr:TetR/AcrR family transcriptional regulator [Actinomycetota bacterium]
MSNGPRTRLDPAQRRAQILGHAVRVFREQPYSEVSLDQIASETGVTRGLLHHYYGSKRNLYLDVLRTVLTIPDDVPIVPPGVDGDLRTVLNACVRSWMQLVRQAGGLWPGSPGAGIAEDDIDEVVGVARDALVERMLVEVPFPDALDRGALRAALRSYAAFAGMAIQEWLAGGPLNESQTHVLLLETLVALAERVVPEMTLAADR